jgi:hypothetical protein
MTLVFAYGSNLADEDLRSWAERHGRPMPTMRPFGLGWLRDRALSYTRWSSRRKGGVLDVVPSRGSAVDGMIFEATLEDMALLDAKEGVPTSYVRTLGEVQVDGAAIPVAFYEVPDSARAGPFPPTPEYVQAVTAGRRRYGLRCRSLEDPARVVCGGIIPRLFVERESDELAQAVQAGGTFMGEAFAETRQGPEHGLCVSFHDVEAALGVLDRWAAARTIVTAQVGNDRFLAWRYRRR